MKHTTSFLFASVVTALVSGCNDGSSNSDIQPQGRWVKSDMHFHSTASDGHNLVTTVMDNGFNKYDMDILMLTDHGGFKSYGIDPANMWRMTLGGAHIIDEETVVDEPHSHDYAKEEYPEHKQKRPYELNSDVTNEHINQYRDTSLDENKYAMKGLEWTAPDPEEHLTVFIDDGTDSAEAINQFHNNFNKGNDNIGEGDNAKYENMLDAVKFLQSDYPSNSFITFNHPSKNLEIRIEHIRDVLALGSDVVTGMEGAPGHQRHYKGRGGYDILEPVVMSKPASEDETYIGYHGITYGGFDYMTSKVGGLWDALLHEGHEFSIFIGSDFHTAMNDFWPGQYSKTHLFLKEESNKGIIDALKEGNAFVTTGDLISSLVFTASQEGKTITMGNQATLDHTKPATIKISFTMPESNHNGDSNEVAFVDVILGEIANQTLVSGDEMYDQPYTDTVQIVESFEKGQAEWTQDGNRVTLSLEIDAQENPYYLRLRGSNTPKCTAEYVDCEGNPLVDSEKMEDIPSEIEAVAWKDLWFYSNPIYVNPENQ